MSAPGPYQSKLFNFLNRQSIQWSNRLTQAARRLKITVEWGTQIALYPMYLLVQTSRVAVRQIAAAQAERQRLALADHTAPPETEPQSMAAIAQTDTPLQGLACDLVTRDILFVEPDNQTHQPPQPQAGLKRRISFYLGSTNYEKRQQALASHPPKPRILPPIQGQGRHLLPPVRWLLQGLSWLEHSPVAIAIDLFGESHWHTAVIPPEIYSPQLLPPLPLGPVLKPLDQRFAKLEQQLLTPATPTEKVPPLQRFFRKFLKSQRAARAITVTQNPTPEPAPWLTWNDLFQEKIKATNVPTTAPPQPPLVESLLPDLATPKALIKTANEPGAIAATIPPQTLGQTQAKFATDIEAKPAWIETEALSIGYEQHFLERLLKALDHLLAWLENTATQLLNKLNGLKK
ncbi:hypothetical protein FLX56_25555 [Synechococcus moorigangaii CMS01]|nr:hypothetical protein [Synechococcus moorigangaii CMS01]